jgi:hypothetical protein
MRPRVHDVLTVQPCNRLRERCSRRLINPVGQLGLGQHIDKIRLIAGHQNMLADLRRMWPTRVMLLPTTCSEISWVSSPRYGDIPLT